ATGSLSSAAPKFIKKINETEGRKPYSPVTRPSRLQRVKGYSQVDEQSVPPSGQATTRPEGRSAPYSRIPPPSSNSSPVTQPESSDARKRAAFAISSAVPMRPRGVRVTASCSKPFLYSGSASTPSVSVAPGESELTRIFRGASSKASAREITSTAPLVALYTELLTTGVLAAMELTLMMLPPWPFMCATASLVVS